MDNKSELQNNITENYDARLFCETDPTRKRFEELVHEEVIPKIKKRCSVKDSSKFSGKYNIFLDDSLLLELKHEHGAQNEGYIIKISVLDKSDNINPESNKETLNIGYKIIEEVFPNVKILNY